MTYTHDIGITGGVTNVNIGGGLTYYALYHLLSDMGYKTLMIPCPLSAQFKPDMAMSGWRANPYPSCDFAPAFSNKEEMRKKLNDKCKIFVVGSDQMFHPNVADWWDRYMWLDWVDDSKNKISIATSFGRDSFETNNKNMFKIFFDNLSRFNSISVREKSGIDIFENEFGIKGVKHTIDPVFLCDIEDFDALAEIGKTDKDSVFCYILDDTTDKQKIVQDVSLKILKSPVVMFDDPVDWEREYIKKESSKYIEDFIAGIKDSKFVITDSFHCVCFAILYKKPFVAIVNTGRGVCRYRFFTEDLGLSERIVNSFEEYKNIDDIMDIDYAPVVKKLEVIKQDSLDWIIKAINNKDKRIKFARTYPKWLVNLICAFMPKKTSRYKFRKKYSKK